MVHAYTPGLKAAEKAVIRKKRTLPIPGETLVKTGEYVSSTTIVARASLPGEVYTVNVVNLLGIQPEDIRQYMLRKEGETVEKDDPLAENRPFIKWFKTHVRSPIKGTVESISNITGQVLLREPPRPLELPAYIDGKVVEVIEKQGVTIEAWCTFIQGIFGIGGETWGEIEITVENPEDVLGPDRLDERHKGKIIIGGSQVIWDTLHKAKGIGIKGIVVGGMDAKDLKRLLGYDLGVAITGTEDVGFTLILTEGFGRIPMAKRTFELLTSKAGKKASISGATQIRAGVIRPEVIVPSDEGEARYLKPEEKIEREGLKIGDSVRIIREPYFGKVGKIIALPPEPAVIPTESKVRVLEVEFTDERRAVIPRANVEIMEE